MKRIGDWLTRLIQDPDGSPSSTRVAALLCTLTGCGVAIWGMAVAREQASTVTALVGGAAGAFFARRKSTDVEPSPPAAP